MKILIFGANGLLGSYISNFLLKKKYSVIRACHKTKCDISVNLTDYKDTKKKIQKIKPHIIINCAANVDVDDCEKNFWSAINGNVITIRNIVQSIKKLKLKSHLIHISTDQVYNNLKPVKKSSENNINFVNNYGFSKHLGERQLLDHKRSLIIRTNFFGKSISRKKISFSDWVLKSCKEKKKIKIPSNIIFNPIHMKYLSHVIEICINKKVFGIYNVGSKDSLSKYQFSFLIAKKFNLNYKSYLKKIKSTKEINKRPLNTYMNVARIERKLMIKLPKIIESIDLL